MGNACGGNQGGQASTPEEQARQKAIEKMLKEDRRMMLKEVKLLLLGAGQSGKSTLAKQMKVLYLNGFSDSEKLAFKEIVAGNIYTNTHALVKGALRAGLPLTAESQVSFCDPFLCVCLFVCLFVLFCLFFWRLFIRSLFSFIFFIF